MLMKENVVETETFFIPRSPSAACKFLIAGRRKSERSAEAPRTSLPTEMVVILARG